jgi:copper chaperone NosL
MKDVSGVKCQVSGKSGTQGNSRNSGELKRWQGSVGGWDLGFGIFLTLSLLLVVLLVGCSAGGDSGPQPPEIAYGFDTCATCGMLISEARFAAATLLANGETRKFDDIGNMMIYHMDHPNETVAAWFVHDYGTEEWLRGEGAYFVMAGGIHSPMGSGIAAFADEGEAEALAEEYGTTVMDMDDLRAAVHVTMHSH